MNSGPSPECNSVRSSAARDRSSTDFDAKTAGRRGRREIDAGAGGARLHAGGAVVAVVETDDRKIFRLLDADGGERAERHQHVAVAGDHGDAAVGARQREAEAHRRRAAKPAPDVEIARIVAAGRDVIGRRADAGDDQQAAALLQQFGDELAAVHGQWPFLLRSTMRCDNRIATWKLPPVKAMRQAASTVGSTSASSSIR